jgi:protein-disulfide isomerase
MKAWYEENKSRIPPNYQFDQIKGEIAKIVKQEEMKKKRESVVEKIKKDKKFSLALTAPVSPVIELKTDGFPSKGKDGAKVTVVEFADYQCPHCKSAAEAMKKISEKMKDRLKFVYIDFPINPSGISKLVAEGSHCAGEQGKYWEYHYKAFEGQSTLDKESPSKLAKELKLDEAKFKACFDGTKSKAIVEKGRQEGDRIGVSGTPYIIINNRRYLGAHTVEALTKEIEASEKAR